MVKPYSIDKSKALSRAQWLCSKQERCSSSIMVKLTQWGITANDAAEIISSLKSDGFINEKRYALSFAREKACFSKWGPKKIEMALRAKRIPNEDIEIAIMETLQYQSADKLDELIAKKARTTKYKNIYDLKNKLLRFGISRGFEYSQVLASLEKVIDNLNKS
jgi:regulatory protein